MASSPPPFPAPPGYHWDPLKKRFFKKDPKQAKITDDDGDEASSSSTKRVHGGSSSNKKKGKKQRREEDLLDGDEVAQFRSAFTNAPNLANLRLEASQGAFDVHDQTSSAAYRV
jgi:hypothetical protein